MAAAGSWNLHWLLLLLQMAAVRRGESSAGAVDQDWSQCPPVCHCTWVGGKRSADCQDAGFSSLPSFRHADQIQVLHLAANPILRLPETIFNQSDLINLQKVYLQNCSLNIIHPTAFLNLVLMIELDLSHNNIRSLLPGTFKGNIRIRKLWLHHNPLRTIQDFSFPTLSHLRSLDLSHCMIRKIGQETFHNINLIEVLSLSDNQLHRLDPAAFRPLGNLKSLKLSRNPWHCDCRLETFWHWVMGKNLYNKPTVCQTPAKLAGTSWDALEQPELACPPRVTVRQPERSVTLGSEVRLSCFIGGGHKRVNWVRSGFIVKNNSASLDGGTQSYKLKTARVSNRRRWLNLTISHLDRTGSGVYSCVAESDGGMTEKNATIVITDSSTYLGRKEINMMWVAVIACAAVASLLFFAMAFFAVREKKRRGGRLLPGQSEVALKPGDSAVIFSRAMDLKCAKAEYDSPVVTDLLEREREQCNSSNSNNSACSGSASDSGVGSSSSNIVRLEQSFGKHGCCGPGSTKGPFPDLVTLPISEEDTQGNQEAAGLYSYQKPHFTEWLASDSTTSLMRAEAEPPECPVVETKHRDSSFQDRDSSLPRRLPSWPNRSPSTRRNGCETSLPRRVGQLATWRDLPTSITDSDFKMNESKTLTDSDFALMKQELAARKLANRTLGGRQAFLLAKMPNPRLQQGELESRSQLLNALVQDHSDTVV